MSARTVLVVEDEPYLRRMLADLLRAEGYAVEEAADGAEALDVVERYHVAPKMLGLVVLDLMLPRVSGLEVLQRLPALGLQVPVVATSVSGRQLAAAMAAGAARVLPKPFDPGALLEIVGRSCLPPVAERPAGAPRAARRARALVAGRRLAALHAPRCRMAARRLVRRALGRLEATARALELELTLLDALFRCRPQLPGLD